MDYKSNIILIIVGLIIHKLILVFNLKFSYAQLDFIYMFKKFYTTSAFKQLPTGSKKFSHYGHPIILKYYKIFVVNRPLNLFCVKLLLLLINTSIIY